MRIGDISCLLSCPALLKEPALLSLFAWIAHLRMEEANNHGMAYEPYMNQEVAPDFSSWTALEFDSDNESSATIPDWMNRANFKSIIPYIPKFEPIYEIRVNRLVKTKDQLQRERAFARDLIEAQRAIGDEFDVGVVAHGIGILDHQRLLHVEHGDMGLEAVCIPSRGLEREEFDRQVVALLKAKQVDLVCLDFLASIVGGPGPDASETPFLAEPTVSYV